VGAFILDEMGQPVPTRIAQARQVSFDN